MTTARDHPIAPPSGIVAVARLALYEKIGPGPHPCNWCGEPVDWILGLVPGCLVADHLNWDRNDDRPENLVPSCRTCNAHRAQKGNRPLLRDGDITMLWGGRPTRAVERACAVCGASFLTIPAEVAKGKGRSCSRSCAAKLRMRERGFSSP